RVRLAGKGEPGPRGGPPGDLYVVTRVGDSPIFRRKGQNVEVEVPITIPEAIRGATVEVPTLSGSKRLRVPAGTKHGTVQRLRGEVGVSLAGVERVCELEGRIARMTQRMEPLELRAEQIEAGMAAEVERVRREFRAEIVPSRPPQESLIPARDLARTRIRVRR